MTAHRETSDLLIAQHRSLATDQVRQVLVRVPAHVDRHQLQAVADAALARVARSTAAEDAAGFATRATREIRAVLRDRLRSLPCSAPETSPAAPADRLRDLEAAIAALPAPLRDVVTGYFLQGRPTAEIAGESGLDRGQVSALVVDALERLRDALNAGAADVKPTHAAAASERRRRGVRVTRRTTSVRFANLGRRRGLAGPLSLAH